MDGVNGRASSGGGGGASGIAHPSGNQGHATLGGNGGSGVVIIRYLIGSVTAAKATGGQITSYAPTSPSPMRQSIHAFTSSGTFANTSGSPIPGASYLVVGGGGSGAGTNESADGAAGGGAGGVLSNHPDVPAPLQVGGLTIGTSPYTVTVGAGGRAGAFGPPTNPITDGSPGTSSSFGPGIIRMVVVVEDLLVQVKMVKMVDLVVVHQVADLLEMVAQEIG